ncbi:MAG TPA: hypothetical protein VK909_08690 [Anaerolineales bacterium]|nr:hypothetical protein [Anaerolineales bacterium]
MATARKPQNTFRIAWQSALAASLCLGLPAGLVFWLAILQHVKPNPIVEKLAFVLLQHAQSDLIGALIGAFLWGIFLSRISGYLNWWLLVAASMLGIYFGRRLFWIVYVWIHYDFSEVPPHISLAIHLVGQILSVTFFTGLTHGLLLRSWRAAITLTLATSLISVLAATVTYIILDQLGLHIGGGNFVMPKVAAVCTMVSAILGGMVLGVEFTRLARENLVGDSNR